MENKIRNTLNDIYFGKTKDIVNGLRSTVSAAENKQKELLKQDLASALQKRNQPSSNWRTSFVCRAMVHLASSRPQSTCRLLQRWLCLYVQLLGPFDPWK